MVCASLAIGVVALSAALGGPVLPMWALGSIGSAYLALLAWGSLAPRLEMYGDVLWRVPEATGRLALTFDDGPDATTTPLVLDLLRERGARATFFVLGARALAEPALLQRMVAEGHAVGLHSFDHNRLYAFLQPRAVCADVEHCRSIVEAATGARAIWFRPPVGQMSPRTAAGVKLAGAEVVGWSARGRDGLSRTSSADVLKRLTPRLEAGAIVLLHDAWERPKNAPSTPPAGVLALPALLDEIARRGLQAVTLDELVLGAAGRTTTKRAPGA